MPLFRRREPIVTAHTPLGTGSESTSGPEKRRTRGRDQIERDLRRQLAILASRHETAEMDEPELGLVVQAHRNIGGSYVMWRSSWDRRLRQIKGPGGSGPLSAERWPAQIVENGWGLILLGVPPGASCMIDRAPVVKTASTSTRRSRRDVVLAMPLAAQTRARDAPPDHAGADGDGSSQHVARVDAGWRRPAAGAACARMGDGRRPACAGSAPDQLGSSVAVAASATGLNGLRLVGDQPEAPLPCGEARAA